MRYLAAPDKFKGCLNAGAVATAIAQGIRAADASAEIRSIPMADGGDGTLDVLAEVHDGRMRRMTVAGPLGLPHEAQMSLIDDARTGVIELARICGIGLLRPDQLDPLNATTLGVGQAMAAAMDAGVGKIILAVGGSASVDGGLGMMQGLGVRCIDRGGRPLPLGAGGGRLAEVIRIEVDDDGPLQQLRSIQVIVLMDVLNPLTGPHGAARVFGPQKGATPEQAALLERGLDHWAGVLELESGMEVRHIPGMGAAGGVAAPLVALGGATLVPGVDFVIEATQLAAHVAWADIVITGEGRLDGQSRMGKVVSGVGRLARSCGKPCVAIVGSLGPGHELSDEILDQCIALTSIAPSLESAQSAAAHWLERAGELLARSWIGGGDGSLE